MLERRTVAALLILAAFGCGGDGDQPAPPGSEGTASLFDLDGDWSADQRFYDFPFPSDLRLDADGHPVLDGFLNADDNFAVSGVLEPSSLSPIRRAAHRNHRKRKRKSEEQLLMEEKKGASPGGLPPPRILRDLFSRAR